MYETSDLHAEMEAVEAAMLAAAQKLEFEKAAQLRDKMMAIRGQLVLV
ncbi:MAG: UvrB/UvrC motif-containing protein [Anaerolineales bacterium]|nr:UvrB/UvrC motif-containing protein [Anaerolineales bacterium]